MSTPLPHQIAVLGLGYAGLPLAVEFGKKRQVIGFDIKPTRIDELRAGRDSTLEVEAQELAAAKHLTFTTREEDLRQCGGFIVAVPTPVDSAKRPYLAPLVKASKTVGRVMPPRAVVIYETTVFPGATEEGCVPILERESGGKFNLDFFCGYSPERVNPGDKQHRLPTIRKGTSGSTPAIADFVDALCGTIITAGAHKASCIKVAEAARVIENTQRDLNIALMNELALIFHRLGIDTLEVLKAAGTKWNFLRFRPGLVGGHCIGIDPYYLTHKAQKIGYHPEVILAGRRINDSMGGRVAGEVIKLMTRKGINVVGAKIVVLGFTFKGAGPTCATSRSSTSGANSKATTPRSIPTTRGSTLRKPRTNTTSARSPGRRDPAPMPPSSWPWRTPSLPSGAPLASTGWASPATCSTTSNRCCRRVM